jgi:diaminopimelate epimerase
MKIQFHKYQGTGNDFIILDHRFSPFIPDAAKVAFLCNRRFGIGADGLMLLKEARGYDFEMQYFNCDGKESTLCGNGGRCMTAFASKLGLTHKETKFLAADGEHISRVIRVDGPQVLVSLKMNDTAVSALGNNHFFVDTGSPHYILFVKDATSLNVPEEARKIRYNETYRVSGTNVDFVEFQQNSLFVRSYERGVEDETLSCGTGATAAALAAAVVNEDNPGFFNIQTPGGLLKVSFKQEESRFTGIWLEGPAMHVFSGEIEI